MDRAALARAVIGERPGGGIAGGRTFSRRELLGSAAGAAGAALATGLGGSFAGVAGATARPDAARLAAMLAEERADPALAPPTARASERQLVLATLYGGNDGLNMLVPYDDPAYISQRSAMRIFPDAVARIADGLGLHPALVGIKALWDAGHVAIVRGVGYPDPNLSHFASMSIWMTGDPTGATGSGWLGRWLDATGTDPLRAMTIGPTVPQLFAGEKQQASALQDSTDPSGQLPPGNKAFQAVYSEAQRITSLDTGIENVIATSGTNMLQIGHTAHDALAKTKPLELGGRDAGDFGTELGVVAQMIEYGLPTKAYQVQMGGYDTHADELGTQAQLLSQLDAGVTAFFNATGRSAKGAGAVLVLYSEFGRRVWANASGGTDHGAANVVFVVGRSVKGGFYGEMPSLARLDEDGNLVHHVDFRSVYATLLTHLIGVEPRNVLGKAYSDLGFL